MQSGIRNRGFASMDAAKQREIARKGGRAAHARGTAHEFSVNEARAAGRKGGESGSAERGRVARAGRGGRRGGRAAPARGPAHEFSVNEARAAGRKGGESVSANRDHMSRIGRIGG